MVEIINKVLMMIFVFSTLNVFRHAFYFTQAWLTSTAEETKKYIITNNSLILLGVSISYIIAIILTGFGI